MISILLIANIEEKTMSTTAIGTIARVNFPEEVVEKEFSGMAVIKASPEMGFLVWLNDYGGDYSRLVTVSKRLGEVSISTTFRTVGNFYFLSYKRIESIVHREFENVPVAERGEGNEKYHQLYVQIMERLMADPVRDACRRLGVTKLWKHGGSPGIADDHEVVVFDLTERGPITIEAQC